MEEYIVFKSKHGRIRIRITTNDNAIEIKGDLTSTEDGVDPVHIHKSFQLDDPNLNQKVGPIWGQFKTALAGLATHAIAGVESKYTDHISNL